MEHSQDAARPDGSLGGMTLSIPTVLNFCPPALKAKVVPEVLGGQKRMVLTEPPTGSDVASIRTVAPYEPREAYRCF
ncbi:hypothetical protein RO3G_04626 [Rhizopus delemar RA 99-880]|uniref:Uncharacterized protein n=1 Tax=Rhizopus delemar (strain RA 99-880 / ATCC MYA-4621 / FGSC 9543 / NRRL 43880) TaxID=246409 RepID=I1BUP1_RHIO9|nr:hypothetical protein RO3G_04626 [Rhizopus delemar RA 99-880]|eukprot:EIE79921.1 hypothetical protein RO3G_04626 [Rhizopus delemar RA 99-880]